MVGQSSDTSLATAAELQALFTAMDDLVLIRDAEGYCQKILTPHSRLLYRPAEQMLRHSLHDSLPPPIADLLLTGIQTALARQEPVSCEYALALGDRTVWLDSRLSPMSDRRVMQVVREISERKQLEFNLAQSQAQLQVILDRASAAIVSFLIDPSRNFTQYLYYSAGCEQIYGFPAAALLADETLWRSRVHPDDWQQVVWPAFTRLLTETRMSIEYRFLSPQNTWRWLAETATATWDADQQCWGVITVAQDISDRKQLEAEREHTLGQLREQAERLRLTLELNSIGSWEWNLETDEITWDDQFSQLIAGTTAGIVPTYEQWRACVHPDDIAAVEAELVDVLHYPRDFQNEYRVVHRDGSIHWIAGRGAVLQAADVTVRFTGVVVDISDRKAIEHQFQGLNEELHQRVAAQTAELRRSEAQFRTVFDAAPLPLSLADIQTRQFVQVNPAYQDWLGYPLNVLYTKTFLDLTHPEDVAADLHISQAMQSGTLRQTEFRKRLIKQSGEIVWADLRVVLICDSQDRPLYSLSLSQDVTEAMQLVAARDQAEAALRQRAERDQLLRRLTQHIHQSFNLDEILAIAVTEARQILKADRALILQLRTDGTGVVLQESVVEGYPNTQAGSLPQIALSAACYDYYFAGVPRIVQDLDQDPYTLRPAQYLSSVGVQSKLTAPIIQIPDQGDRHLWGLLIVHACAAPRVWQPEEADLLQQMANQLAIAIQQVTLYQQVQRDLAERQAVEAQLRILLQEKDVLLKEVHHRVKNNLQVISSLLRMQSRLVEEPVAELLTEAQNRVQSISIIHEHLYQSVDLSRINFEEYVQILVNNLLRSYGVSSQRIQVQLEIANVSLGLNTAIPCGLIINELVSNALKYAFSTTKSGEIKICLRSQSDLVMVGENQAILIVQDNGVGFPADVDWQSSRSLGLRIVSTLVDQLQGTITLDRDRGTAFQITFPLSVASGKYCD